MISVSGGFMSNSCTQSAYVLWLIARSINIWKKNNDSTTRLLEKMLSMQS